ncbi:MAG: hypothetical protein IJ456_03710 [Bacteroides sp.]|nr:hypothetical protein [Bacteroides sp.]
MRKGVAVDRYAVIHTKLPREFVLLQGTGCRWRKCAFCDYHEDGSDRPFETNRQVLQQVTGIYGVLDVINSGSAIELDEETLAYLLQVVEEKHIHTLWFEMHYMYRHRLEAFAKRFAPVQVKFRCGVETFDTELRQRWHKGIPPHATPSDIARYFQGVCLLCGTEGESRAHILADIETARTYFEYFSVNVFCNNHTPLKRDEALVDWFVREVYPLIKDDPHIEVLIDNTDLGVG